MDMYIYIYTSNDTYMRTHMHVYTSVHEINMIMINAFMHQLLLNCVNRSTFENKNSFKLERMRSENIPAAP